jgi:hypothetical protein
MTFSLRTLLVGLAISPSVAWACSGEFAMEAMQRARIVGWVSFGLTLLLALPVALIAFARIRQRSAGVLVALPAFLLAVLHPRFWLSPFDGDCGQDLRLWSVLARLAQLTISFLYVSGMKRSGLRRDEPLTRARGPAR